jgi:hypothetical protein
MSEDNQIHIPASFLAVYADARQRLVEPIAVVRVRYEVCEDLASHLVQHAQLLHHAEVPSEAEILQRVRSGLDSPDSGLSPAEAWWVVQRLAELLDWPYDGRSNPPTEP